MERMGLASNGCGSVEVVVVLTVLLGACGVGGGFCGDDALAGFFGDGDHEVVDFLEVKVCHGDGVFGKGRF
jgi:hypothetical protein